MKASILPLIMATLLLFSSCQKTSIQPSVNSSTVSDARKSSIQIVFDWYYRGSQYATLYDGAGTNLGTGDVIYDSCEYAGLRPTCGRVRIDGTYNDSTSSTTWTILIEEIRSRANMTIGDPYYYISYFSDAPIIYYSSDIEKDIEDGLIWRPDAQSGPFRDTTTAGSGKWKIISSTHPLIKKASGNLIYNASIWYGFGRFSQGGDWDDYTPYDVVKVMWPYRSTLNGTYK
jgi:hypothetical protein